MKLLVDEHYSSKIAEQLRERGHDVTAVEDQEVLRGRGDREIWIHAVTEQRAVVTENVRHFMPIVLEASRAGERHHGLVITSSRSMPRGRGTIGVFVDSLDSFLSDRPGDDALADQVAWLSQATR